MRSSQFLISTQKEIPADAEVVSHQLMLRAGMIRKLAAGVYTWLPLGLRVLRKVEQIVREEMNAAGALEILMPAVQPAELWKESDRWQKYGPELLRLHDRHQREFCFGPTHEEVVTDLVRREIRSYKQLPLTLYQIQTKFRDEIRPRFGVLRAREFIMKDAYSFHTDHAGLEDTYQRMYQAYSTIFTRIGLHFRAVDADTGAIGGSRSHEFHVLADSGEDAIAFSDGSDYAANVEQAPTLAPAARASAAQTLSTVETPSERTIEEVCAKLNITPAQCIKTLVVQGENKSFVAFLLRGDHELNLIKAQKIAGVLAPITFATPDEVNTAFGCTPGFIGPINTSGNTSVRLIADHAALSVSDFVCGANQVGKHFAGVNWERDLPVPPAADLRNVVAGDASPDGKGHLSIARGIEVGHIFQLGTRYSEKMQASVLDEQGKALTLTMGCYGIGVTRVVAAAIEQNHDEQGIIWPLQIAPFQLVLIPLQMQKSEAVRQVAEKLYAELVQAGVEVLLEDSNQRPGVMFANMELIGIPHRLVVAERGLEKGVIEYKGRRDASSTDIKIDEVLKFIKEKLKPHEI